MARRGAKRRVQRVEIEWFGDEFLKIVAEHGAEALFAAGEVLRAEAARRAPRRTGKLAGSGYVAVQGKSTYVRRLYWRREKPVRQGEAVVAFTAPHAHLMESGRRKRGVIRPTKRSGKRALVINGRYRASSQYKRMSSRPFVGPAIDASQEQIPRELVRIYGSWLDKLLGGRP
jgi:hypothetical protein